MVNLSEAGGRLAAHHVADPTSLSDIHGRRARRRRRRRATGAGAGVVAAGVVVALVLALVGSAPSRKDNVTTNPGPPAAQAAGATAQQLAAGHWSTIPAAPIPARDDPQVVWGGRELIEWGGQSGPNGQAVRADGAAYDPTTNRWRVLPPAPISGRVDAAVVWTGTEMIIWGGYTSTATPQVSDLGAAYNPTTNTWRLLPASPLSARAGPQAIWTGNAMLILGGDPAVATQVNGGDPDGALYYPATNTWRTVNPPAATAGHPLGWSLVAQSGSTTLAWSDWSDPTPNAGTATGVDLYSYDDSTGRWTSLNNTGALVIDPGQALPLGPNLFVRGNSYYCGPCSGPEASEASAIFNPRTDTWTPIVGDPIANSHPQSASTGAAIISLDLNAIASRSATTTIGPGASTAYDPEQHQWRTLPSAPAGCAGYQPPIWTGQQIIALCAEPRPQTNLAGTILTPSP